jgi:hypothetical protein
VLLGTSHHPGLVEGPMHGIRHNPMTTYTDDNPVNHHVTTNTLGSLDGRLGDAGHPSPSVELSATALRCAVGAVLRGDGADPRPCSPDSVARRLLQLGSTHAAALSSRRAKLAISSRLRTGSRPPRGLSERRRDVIVGCRRRRSSTTQIRR